ncbi:MAG: hypothetical protein C0399_06795 [Syntrophus sp. (in: bacteria)]|nr:hypothetical protein [Syntrophus sp. (in: bacteria)]
MKKKSLVIIIVVLIGISLALPATSQARWYGHRGGRGWYGAGAFTGGVLLGAAIARPWYYTPAPVYVYPYSYPPPTVVYTTPPPGYFSNQGYAYPDPAVTSRLDGNPSPGQWVEVPGQSINGKWVPPHRAWVLDNP